MPPVLSLEGHCRAPELHRCHACRSSATSTTAEQDSPRRFCLGKKLDAGRTARLTSKDQSPNITAVGADVHSTKSDNHHHSMPNDITAKDVAVRSAPVAKAHLGRRNKIPHGSSSATLHISGAELYSGTVPYLTAAPVFASRCTSFCFRPLLFIECQPEMCKHAALILPEAIDFGALRNGDLSICDATTSPSFVAITFECAPYLKCGAQKM